MRQYELTEAKTITLTDFRGKRFQVIRNPSRAEYISFLKQSFDKHLRGFAYKDELWLWDAYHAEHGQISNDLGIVQDEAINAHFYANDPTSDEYDKWLIANNAAIKRISLPKLAVAESVEVQTGEALASEIRMFLDLHAKIAANYDPDYDDPEERFNGPDSVMMEMAAISLEKTNSLNFHVNSSWNSGCYKGDNQAESWHNELISKLTSRVEL